MLLHPPTCPQRREMLGLPPGDTDPMLDDMSDGEPDFEEPMEVVDARARLTALAAAQGADAAAAAGERAPPSRRPGAGPWPRPLVTGCTLPRQCTPGLAPGTQPAAPPGPNCGGAPGSCGAPPSAQPGSDQGACGTATQDDARDYFASVRECQAVLDAAGPALMASDKGAVARLPGVRAAGAAALAALAAAAPAPPAAPAAPEPAAAEAAAPAAVSPLADGAACGSTAPAEVGEEAAGAADDAQPDEGDGWGSEEQPDAALALVQERDDAALPPLDAPPAQTVAAGAADAADATPAAAAGGAPPQRGAAAPGALRAGAAGDDAEEEPAPDRVVAPEDVCLSDGGEGAAGAVDLFELD
jgi:hypothetical protein